MREEENCTKLHMCCVVSCVTHKCSGFNGITYVVIDRAHRSLLRGGHVALLRMHDAYTELPNGKLCVMCFY